MAEKKIESEFECIIAIVNTGFSDVVMAAAREAGAHGGTIAHGRGTSSKSMEKKYGVAFTPDKELVMMVVKENIRDKVMEAIYKAAGVETQARGIVFSIPASHTVGMKFDS